MLASELEENSENTAFCFSEENDPWELGLVRLFKRKTCYCLAFVLYKRESLPSKFPECEQTINEAWVFGNDLFIFSRFLLFVEIISSSSRISWKTAVSSRGWSNYQLNYLPQRAEIFTEQSNLTPQRAENTLINCMCGTEVAYAKLVSFVPLLSFLPTPAG